MVRLEVLENLLACRHAGSFHVTVARDSISAARRGINP